MAKLKEKDHVEYDVYQDVTGVTVVYQRLDPLIVIFIMIINDYS